MAIQSRLTRVSVGRRDTEVNSSNNGLRAVHRLTKALIDIIDSRVQIMASN